MPLSEPIQMRLKRGDTIVFEGDSLSSRRAGPAMHQWAFGRLMNWHVTFPQLVDQWLFTNLPKLRLTRRHAAVSGSTIDDMLHRYEPVVRPLGPTLMVFTIGNNDPHRMSLEQFEDRLQRYLDRLAADGCDRLLYVGGFGPCPGGDATVGPRCEAAAPFNDAAARRVQQRGGDVLRVGPALRVRAEALHNQSTYHTVYAEGRHLNLLGAHIVATQALQALGVIRVHQPEEHAS
jgi:hypothetical protein